MTAYDLTAEDLLHGYASGIFPMAENRDDPEVFWVDPHFRGVLPLDGFHISRSLRKRILRGDIDVSSDRAFAAVVDGCADRDETWINPSLHRLYRDLHKASMAHSAEVWHDGQLMGGVFGIVIGGAFFGESMFSTQRDGSKLALAFLTHHLQSQGFRLFDTQFITSHLASLGAIEIPRHIYHEHLRDALELTPRFGAITGPDQLSAALQRRTQTS